MTSSGEGGQQDTWAPVSRRWNCCDKWSKNRGRMSTSGSWMAASEASCDGMTSSSVIVDLLLRHHLVSFSAIDEADLSIKFVWHSPANPPYNVSCKSIFSSCTELTPSLPIFQELLEEEVRGATTWLHSQTRGSLQ